VNRLEAVMARWCAAAARIPWLRAALLSPVIARPGYALATACGWLWGAAIHLGPYESRGGVVVCEQLPAWAFGRGGTTIGAVYLTRDNTRPAVLRHEAVHRAQWKHYGLAFIPLYVAAGADARHNRFEIEAGLADGGYA
jgi:hypothetical protein